jgi:hypothetical protein
MAIVEWTALPTLWPQPAVSIGSFELLVFTQDGVPTWEVRYNPKIAPIQSFDLVTAGTADSFEGANQGRDLQPRGGPGDVARAKRVLPRWWPTSSRGHWSPYALTQHLGESQRHHFWTNPNDLLHLLLALFIVALAHIFGAGVAIADENRQIV